MSHKLLFAAGILLIGLMSGCGSAPKVLTALDVVVCPPKPSDLDCPYSQMPPAPSAGDPLPLVLEQYQDTRHLLYQCKEAVELRDRAWKRCKALTKQ